MNSASCRCSRRFDLVPGPVASWKAILPSLAVVGEPFRLAIVAEDMWGNPTADADGTFKLVTSRPLRGLPESVAIKKGDGPRVIDKLIADAEGDLDIGVVAAGKEIARANPLRVVAKAAPLRRYWGDLHGQSGETIGMGSAEAYFRYARDAAFIDMVGHQGNDFQITDAFWKKLNQLTAEFDEPGKFVCLPGYEWSGNTGMGGDRNIFYRREGRPIRRSSHILVEGETSTDAIYTADELFRALDGEDAIVIAHVGGRYADVKYAHDGRLERAVEVHSTWGTFEWILHDAFEKGYRVGVVCHSDDHKGRPGATRPGASSFGAIGGLTCYFMPELTRDALFEALRQRRHYGTTGTRIFIDLQGSFAQPVTGFSDDPLLGLAKEAPITQAMMGDIVRPGSVPMRLSADVIGTAPVERVDVLHGTKVAQTFRPFTAADLGRRVRVLWQGAEYRGRGPRNAVGRQAHHHRQPHRALRAGELPQSRTQGARDGGRHGARLDARSRPAISPASICGSMRRAAARSASRPMWCRAASILRRSPTIRLRSMAVALGGGSASIGCRKRIGAARSRSTTPSRSRAARTCRSTCASRKPTATRPGRARST